MENIYRYGSIGKAVIAAAAAADSEGDNIEHGHAVCLLSATHDATMPSAGRSGNYQARCLPR